MRLHFPMRTKDPRSIQGKKKRLLFLLAYTPKKKEKAGTKKGFASCCYPMRRRETLSAYKKRANNSMSLPMLLNSSILTRLNQIKDLIKEYAQLVFYAEKGKQAPHTKTNWRSLSPHRKQAVHTPLSNL